MLPPLFLDFEAFFFTYFAYFTYFFYFYFGFLAALPFPPFFYTLLFASFDGFLGEAVNY
jgi:hypothetical protein